MKTVQGAWTASHPKAQKEINEIKWWNWYGEGCILKAAGNSKKEASLIIGPWLQLQVIYNTDIKAEVLQRSSRSNGIEQSNYSFQIKAESKTTELAM